MSLPILENGMMRRGHKPSCSDELSDTSSAAIVREARKTMNNKNARTKRHVSTPSRMKINCQPWQPRKPSILPIEGAADRAGESCAAEKEGVSALSLFPPVSHAYRQKQPGNNSHCDNSIFVVYPSCMNLNFHAAIVQRKRIRRGFTTALDVQFPTRFVNEDTDGVDGGFN